MYNFQDYSDISDRAVHLVGILFTWNKLAWRHHFTERGGLGTYNLHSFATFHWCAHTKSWKWVVKYVCKEHQFCLYLRLWYLILELFVFRFIAYYIFIIARYTTHLRLGIWSLFCQWGGIQQSRQFYLSSTQYITHTTSVNMEPIIYI